MKSTLIAGLGNHGEEYAHTRHNIGFDVVDAFSEKWRGKFIAARLADVCELNIKGKKAVIIKPSTFMNLSGKSIRYWLQTLNILPSEMMVVVDEMALPLGKIRVNPKGSDGGHNGLKDICEKIQTTEFPRIRFGIDKKFPKGRQTEYVLGKWTEEEMKIVRPSIEKSVLALETFLLEGLEKCMNMFNR